MKFVTSKQIVILSAAILFAVIGSFGLFMVFDSKPELPKVAIEKSEPLLKIEQKKLITDFMNSSFKKAKPVKGIISLSSAIQNTKKIAQKLKDSKLSKSDKKSLMEDLLASRYEIEIYKKVAMDNLGKKSKNIEEFKEVDEIITTIESAYKEFNASNDPNQYINQLDSKIEEEKEESIGGSKTMKLPELPNEEPPKFSSNNYLTPLINHMIPEALAAEILACDERYFKDPTNPEGEGSIFLSLSENEIKPTQDMIDLANELKTPLKIYNYVKNEIRYEPYFGAVQNAESVFMRRVANAYDQASLLISLLRAANIPARFVMGDILMEEGQLQKLWKLENAISVWNVHKRVLARLEEKRGQSRWMSVLGKTYYRLPHMWVEAFIPFDERRGVGIQTARKSWIPLDPSFDNYKVNYQQSYFLGLNNEAQSRGEEIFNVDKFLFDPDPVTNSVIKQYSGSELAFANVTSLLNYANENDLWWQKTFLDYSNHGTLENIQNQTIPIGPTGAEACIFSKTAALPYYYKAKIALRLKDLTLTRSFYATDIGLKSLYVIFDGETQQDRDKLELISDGSLDPTTTGTIMVVPKLMVDDELIATGSPSIFGTDVNLETTVYTIPEVFGDWAIIGKTSYKTGDVLAIHSTFRQASSQFIERKTKEVLDLLEGEEIDTLSYLEKSKITGKILSLSILNLNQKIEKLNKDVAQITNTFNYNIFDKIVMKSGMKPQKFLDRAFGFTPEKPSLDWKSGNRFSARSATIPAPYLQDEFKEVSVSLSKKIFLVSASALEHKIFEDFFSIEGQSTVKVLQVAKDKNQEIINVDINSSNLDSTLAQLSNYHAKQYYKEVILSYGEPDGKFIAPKDYVQIGDARFGVALFYNKNNFGSMAVIGRYHGGHGGTAELESKTGFDISDFENEIGDLDSLGSPSQILTEYEAWLLQKAAEAQAGDPEAIEDTNERLAGNLSDCPIGQPVNFNNGSMWHDFIDFPEIPGPGENLKFKRKYFAQSDYNGPLGYGWTHNYNLRIETIDGSALNISNNQDLKYFSKDGNVNSFRFDDGKYMIPPWLKLSFEKTVDEFIITDFEKKVYKFFGVGDFAGKIKSIIDRNGNVMTFSYNSTTKLLETVTDTVGRTLTFSYNGDNKLWKVTDFSNRYIEFTYDPTYGDLDTSRDLNGEITTYTYLNNQMPTHLNHNLSSFRNPEGHGVDYFYYKNDKVFKHVEAEGKTTIFVYNPYDKETTIIDSMMNRTIYQYNLFGYIKKIINPDNTTITNRWDLFRNKTALIDEEGYETKYTSDERGNTATVTPPAPYGTIEYTYHSEFNIPESIKDGNGNITDFSIDPANGNILSKTQYFDIAKTQPVTISYLYNSEGYVQEITDAKNKKTIITRTRDQDFNETVVTENGLGDTDTKLFDQFGRLIEHTDFNGVKTVMTYDDLGNMLTSEVQGTGIQNVFVYDKAHNLIEEKLLASGEEPQIIKHQFDGLGNRIQTENAKGEITKFNFTTTACSDCRIQEGQVKSIVDPKGYKTEYEYNIRGKVTQIINSKGYKTLYSYDGRGNIIKAETKDRSNNKQFEIKYKHDALNNVVKITKQVPTLGQSLVKNYYKQNAVGYNGGTYTHLTYDQAGNLLEKKTVKGGEEEKLTYSYNGLNLVTQKDLISSKHADSFLYEYDNNLNITRLQTNDSILEYTYNDINLATDIKTLPNASTGNRQINSHLKYVYDKMGQVESIKDGSDNLIISYGYDSVKRINAVTANNLTVAINRDNFGRKNRITYPNGIETTLAFDAANRITSINTPKVGFSNYKYDSSGNIIEIKSDRGQWNFAHDQSNQVIKSNYSGSAPIENESFIWDSAGNDVTGRNINTAFNKQRPLIFENLVFEDARPTSDAYGAGLYAYRYDFKGNVIERYNNETDEHDFYEFNAENKLKVVRRLNSSGQVYKTFNMRYDGLGRRIEKEIVAQDGSVERKQYIYNGDNILLEYDKTGAKKATYAHSDMIDDPLMFVRDNKVYFYHKDHQGSITAITDSIGKVAQTVTYSSFGKIAEIKDGNGQLLSFTGTNKPLEQPFYYTSREWDNNGMYFYRNRYYSPSTQTFLSPDPLGIMADVNLYRYVKNRPVIFSDAYGLAEGSSAPLSDSGGTGDTLRGLNEYLDSPAGRDDLIDIYIDPAHGRIPEELRLITVGNHVLDAQHVINTFALTEQMSTMNTSVDRSALDALLLGGAREGMQSAVGSTIDTRQDLISNMYGASGATRYDDVRDYMKSLEGCK